MSKCVWVEGMIADFSEGASSPYDRYLIERVQRFQPDSSNVMVDFRALNNWQLFKEDTRTAFEADYCVVREATDEELIHIAACRLMGDVDASAFVKGDNNVGLC